jgi:hypothetical protein
MDVTSSGGASGAYGGLDGLRIELPCIPVFYEPQACETTAEVASQKRTIAFGGNPGTTYEVTLRVRGLVELMPYAGSVGAGPFAEGGTPDPNSHYLRLQLQIASPKKDYVLNKGASNGDNVHKLDYMAKVQVQGGSTLTFIALDPNMDQAKNYMNIVVEGIPPAPQPFDGEFVQINVVSVVPPL